LISNLRFGSLTLYDLEMYEKASVRFLVTKNAFANLSKRAFISSSVGGGFRATQGAGVTTWRISIDRVGGARKVPLAPWAGAASAARGASNNDVNIAVRIIFLRCLQCCFARSKADSGQGSEKGGSCRFVADWAGWAVQCYGLAIIAQYHSSICEVLSILAFR
jgi:hypothetical protein